MENGNVTGTPTGEQTQPGAVQPTVNPQPASPPQPSPNQQTGQAEQTEGWDKFLTGSFLKAINIKDDKDPVVCVNTQEVNENNQDRVRLIVEKGGKELNFDLNQTNLKTVIGLGFANHRELIGKKLYFKKVWVNNPQTHQQVESLNIHKIE